MNCRPDLIRSYPLWVDFVLFSLMAVVILFR